jgi:hypothetical protein
MVGCLLFAVVAQATTYTASSPVFIFGPQGRPLSGASVLIKDSTGAPATVYTTASGVTAWANGTNVLPASGLLQFFGSAATYTVSVSGQGVSYTFLLDISAITGALHDNDFVISPGYLYKEINDTYSVKKAQLNGAVAPDPNDDASDGYDNGSIWVDKFNSKVYMNIVETEHEAEWVELSGGGMTTINADATSAQIIAVTTSGTSVRIVDSGSGLHTLAIPLAGNDRAAGLVTNTTQDISGSKTFNGASTYFRNGIDVNTVGGVAASVFRDSDGNVLLYMNSATKHVGIGTTDTSDGVLEIVSASAIPAQYISISDGPGLYVHSETGSFFDTPFIKLESNAGNGAPAMALYYGVLEGMKLYPWGVISAMPLGDTYPTYTFQGDNETGVASDGPSKMNLVVSGVSMLALDSNSITLAGGVIPSDIGGRTGKLICLKANGAIGTCSNAADPNSVCTCV